MSAESQTTQKTSSVNQLIDAVANRAKQAADKQAAENANPPTKGPGGGPSPTEANYSEGESAKENTALNKEVLGKNGPEDTPGPEGGSNTMADREPAQAANVSTAGQDPQGESRQDGPAPQAEPGTSSEVSLTKRAAAWREQAGELAIQYMVEHKLAEETAPSFVKDKLASQKQSGDEATDEEQPETDAQSQDQDFGNDIYKMAAAGDENLSQELRSQVHATLADSYAYGVKVAYEMVGELQAQADSQEQHSQQAAQQATKQAASQDSDLDHNSFFAGYKAAMDEMAAMDPAMAGGAAMGGAEMAGGDMGEDPMAGASDEEILAALSELASQNGMSLEELIMLLQASEGGGDMGGAEMPGGEMPGAEMGGGDEAAPPEEEMKTAAEKLSADKLSKLQRKLAIKQDAVKALMDMCAIGAR